MSNTAPLPPATEMQQAIQQHHGAAFADFPAQPAPAPESDEPVYRAALAACSALGFIAQDAGCLARAWAAQTRRLGFFDAAHWPDEPADFGLQPRPHAQPFAPCPQALGLYAVLPDAAWVGRMARAGVPTVQLRYKCDDAAAIAAARGIEAIRKGKDTVKSIQEYHRDIK